MGDSRLHPLLRDGVHQESGILTPEDVTALREDAQKRHKEIDFFAGVNPDIRAKILRATRRVLNSAFPGQDFTESHESTAVFAIDRSSLGAPRLHRDIRGRGKYETYTPTADIVRVGIYLQDHILHSYGTKFIKGSHLYACWPHEIRDEIRRVVKGQRRLSEMRIGLMNFLKMSNPPIQTGDLLIWGARTIHSANYVRLKACPGLVLPPALERWIPSSLIAAHSSPRAVIFFGMVSPSFATEEYIKHRLSKQAIPQGAEI